MKVPEAVTPYLKDQVSARNHVVVVEVKEISNESSYDVKNCEGDPDESGSTAQYDMELPVTQDDNEHDGDQSDDHSKSRDTDYEPPKNINFVRSLELPSCVKELNLQLVAMESIRYNVSSRATAAIISRTFESLGIITPENTSLVVDRSKIERDKLRLESRIVKNDIDNIMQSTVDCIFFDGKKCKNFSLVQKGSGGLYRDNSAKKEHIIILQQPGDVFLGK